MEHVKRKQFIRLHAEHYSGRPASRSADKRIGAESRRQAPDLDCLSARVRSRLAALERVLFVNCSELDTASLNFTNEVVEVLLATALLHYPDMLLARSISRYVVRIRGAFQDATVLESEVLAWLVSVRQSFGARPD